MVNLYKVLLWLVIDLYSVLSLVLTPVTLVGLYKALNSVNALYSDTSASVVSSKYRVYNDREANL